MTLGVLTELVSQATESVVIAAPFLQAGYGLSNGPLSAALQAALHRGVRVEILSTGESLRGLNLQPRPGDRLAFFQPKANLECDQLLGCHAKFCIADSDAAYVGSANLTGPGLSTQVEMGLLVRGDVARAIADFWSYAVEIGLFVSIGVPE
jgi:phosphatidylserine/phosphatidylglycerophosphate/cardiolipin synthase-like enzyme